ncbi:MAG: GIY-YIG nuclease family protein [Crocinitomicaceae bacterium]|jgi:putative endonuclease
MAVVYILFSAKLNKHYIGSCDNLSDRISKHKDKFYINSYTSKTEDWILCLTIENLEYEQARKIEAHIKQMKSKIYIENMKLYPEIVNRLIDKYK